MIPEEISEAEEPPVEVEAQPEAVGDEQSAEGAEVDPFAELAAERDQITDALARLQADFENFRRRAQRDLADSGSRAAASVVADLLPVLDALDLAAAHLAEAAEVSTEGQALVAARALLLDTLGRHGLERVDAASVPFDPQVHDAVMHAEGDGEPTVTEVMRAGYMLGGQVVRPAMVRVEG